MSSKNILRDKDIKFDEISLKNEAGLNEPKIRMGVNVENVNEQYSVGTYNVDRSFDASSVAVGELADVLATLIEDLKKINLLK